LWRRLRENERDGKKVEHGASVSCERWAGWRVLVVWEKDWAARLDASCLRAYEHEQASGAAR
jgi:hypothetical protein